ncbi:MAG: thiolase family protein [Actinobacteria bacterium]|nr:thiolase family protein [Actinomycetota bacterium]
MATLRDVAIVGVGYSEIERRSEKSVTQLTIEAAAAAVADAALTFQDIDGMASYPGSYDSIPCFTLIDAAGIPGVTWFADISGWAPAAIAPVIDAAHAVALGSCQTALVFRSVKRNREKAPGVVTTPRVGGDMQFRAPFGDAMTSQWLAMWARRHMHEYGTTEEHLGAIAVTFRDHAALNARAPLRDPITLDDYFASRVVTTPFRLLDCDFPVDGAGAVVITTMERARDRPHTPVKVLGGEVATGERPDWEQWPDLTTMASKHASDALWRRTGMSAADVDVAEVYDGFSWLALCWLEDLGFCEKGEGGPFIAEGNVRLGGRIPANTHGGSLSGGRLHAISHVIECVEQLRGEAGERQVEGARTGVVTAGGGTMGGALLLGTNY